MYYVILAIIISLFLIIVYTFDPIWRINDKPKKKSKDKSKTNISEDFIEVEGRIFDDPMGDKKVEVNKEFEEKGKTSKKEYETTEDIKKGKVSNLYEMIIFLHYAFKIRKLAITEDYVLPLELKKKLNNNYYSQDDIQNTVNDMLRHIKAMFKDVKAFVYLDENEFEINHRENLILDGKGKKKFLYKNNPGQYTSYGSGKRRIILYRNFNHSLWQIMAILAHEISHYILDIYSIKIDGDNELLTDLAAIYLGFGDYIFKGYEPVSKTTIKNVNGESKEISDFFTMGYINYFEIQPAIKWVIELRNKEKNLKRDKENSVQWKKDLLLQLEKVKTLYEQNVYALGEMKDRKKISINSQDLHVIMIDSNEYYSGDTFGRIEEISKNINNENEISSTLYKEIALDIDNLSRKILFWNTIISKYL